MKFKGLAAALLIGSLPAVTFAGQYADALSDCVYRNLSSSDKALMTQWAFVNLGKTNAARQIVVIPDAKIKEVNKNAKNALVRILAKACAKESGKVALYESKDGLKLAATSLALRLAQDELKDKFNGSLSDLLSPGSANALKGAAVLNGLFHRNK